MLGNWHCLSQAACHRHNNRTTTVRNPIWRPGKPVPVSIKQPVAVPVQGSLQLPVFFLHIEHL
jgi:hypothetical protein